MTVTVVLEASDLAAIAAAVEASLTDNFSGIPSAVITASQATPIDVNIKKINDVSVVGSGNSADKWRG